MFRNAHLPPTQRPFSARSSGAIHRCVGQFIARIRVSLLAFVLLGASPGVRRVLGADPVIPAVPSTPTIPAAPSSVPNAASGAMPEAPAIPGYGEGLPFSPPGSSDMPQMELIPNGMTPLPPSPSNPSLDFGAATPLVPQAPPNVDLKTLKYKVSKFTVKYGGKGPPNPRLPAPQSLANAPVTLSEAPPTAHEQDGMLTRGDLGEVGERYGGLVGPGAGVRDFPVTLSQIKTAETFSGDALQAIYASIVAQINRKGIYGVFVVVDPDQINPSTGDDLRKGGTELTLLVYASEVRQVRTIVKPVAKWPFKVASTSLDDPKYRKITLRSPLSAPVKDKPGSLLQKAWLQDYVNRINRFPGRRVDVAITAAGQDAQVIIDYIVHVERPPVFVFDQTSNTGTEASGTWRTRAGLEWRQLAGLDDILDASFETSLSSSTYSAFGSYQITPIFPDKLKLKLYGGYGRFTAEDVGFDLAQFTGRSATVGLLAIYTPYYIKGFPVDLIAGVEYKNVDITNVLDATSGKANFLLPIVGISTDKTTELYSLATSVQVEPNLPGVIGTDSPQLQNMGRFDVNKSFTIAKYNFATSFFLEPLLFRKRWAAFQDEADPAKRKGFWPVLTEAHEISLQLHGQYTFNDKRLVPQFEDVLGGFSTVRGYPEAYTSGDTSFVANLEYRLHALRLLKPFDTNASTDTAKPPPIPPRFALRPPTILGRPDLDLTLRAFYDFGYVKNNALNETLEADRTLMSVGVGAEVQVSRYLNLRLDWGFPLIGVPDKTSRPVTVGSSRISFVGVISY